MAQQGMCFTDRLKHVLLLFLLAWPSMTVAKINVHELRCEVCKRTVEEIVKDVDSVDPDKRVHVGEFMLDAKGDVPQKTVELRRSEMYLTEMMERICKKMDDYVRAIMRDTGELVVIPLIIDGMMNPIIGDAEIIQDGDLNRSLKFYCENIVEEFDEGFVKWFGLRDPEPTQRICWEHSNLCRAEYEEEYEEDIVAAERRKAMKGKKKRKIKGIKRPKKDPSEMTEQERMIDQISQLPITGPGIPKREYYYEDDEEDEPQDSQPSEEAPKTSEVPEPAIEGTPMAEPVLAGTQAKEEL